MVVSATAFTVWSQSNTNEKVYTVSLLIAAAVSWFMLRWGDRQGDPRNARLVVAAVYLMALGATNHLMSVLPVGAVLLFLLLTRAKLLAHRRFLSRCVLAVVAGLSLNFFLPIRAAQRPVINEGDPLCDGMVETAVAIYTGGAAGCPALASALKREQYNKPPVTQRMAPFPHQLQNFYQYFDWQWSRGIDPDEPPSGARLPFTLLFLALGGAGLFAVWRGDRNTGAYFVVFAATVSVALVFYLKLPARILACPGDHRRAFPRSPGARLLLPVLLRTLGRPGRTGARALLDVAGGPHGEPAQGIAGAGDCPGPVLPEPGLAPIAPGTTHRATGRSTS